MARKWMLFAILTLAVVLRLYHVNAQSFWHDEAVQYAIARQPFATIFSMHYTDILPPLSYGLLHIWLIFGQSDLWARLLPLLAGVIGVFLIYRLGRMLFTANTGLLAALLLAVSPFHIWYSQDIRPYTLMMLFCLLHLIFFIQCLRGGGWRHWGGFGLCAGAAIFNHPFALFTLAAEFFYALYKAPDRGFWIRYLVLMGVLALMYLPFVSIKCLAITASAGTIGNYKPITWLAFPFALYAWLFGFSIGPSLAELHWKTSAKAYLACWPWLAPTLLACLGLTGAWLHAVTRGKAGRQLLLLLTWLMIPLLAVFLLALTSKTTFNVRYCCEGLIPFVLLMALGLDQISNHRRLWTTITALLVLGCGLSLFRMNTLDKYWKEDVRAAGHLLQQQAVAKDIIIVPEIPAFQHYYQGSAKVLTITDTLGQEELMVGLTKPVNTVWLVYYREWMMDPHHELQAWLSKHSRLLREFDYPNCKVICFQQNPLQAEQ